ncbi:MAG: PSD1 and planctomycete cytochrome C domain-containing protein [Planctomycetota bacterium]
MKPFQTSLISLLCLAMVSLDSRSTEPDIDFNRQIRPILSDKCYACHGPDAGQRQADLRLDVATEAFKDRDGSTTISPGNPDSSLLVARIFSEDEFEQMPPADHPKQLSEQEKELLKKWIEQGAAWQDHWAYLVPKRSEPPAADANPDWARNLVDHFISAKLSEVALAPAPEAEPRNLVRRLYFDIIGLPPTPEEVDSFVNNPSDARYEALVDQLLKSPHFGERLAMYWLDLVRYADTVGYHGDQDVSISPYRDYVIKAFNENMPFDQFTLEQIAGDLLPDPTQEQLVASGYNKLGMMSAEGGVQPEEYLAKYAADRVRTASTVWLGSTLGCAECHDHKFDPFTSKDFYRFAAFFADIKERGLYSGANRDGNWGPFVKVADEELPELLKPLDTRLALLNEQFQAETPELLDAQTKWEAEQLALLQSWRAAKPSKAEALHGTKLEIRDDASVLAKGKSPPTNSYTLEVEVTESNTTAIRVEVLPDDSLPQKGPGRAGNGNFVISELRVFPIAENSEQFVLENATATFEQTQAGNENPYKKWAAAAAIDLDVKGSTWGWAVMPEAGKSNVMVAEFKEPIEAGKYRVVVEQNHTNPSHTLGKFRLSFSAQAKPVRAESQDSLDEKIKTALGVEVAQRNEDQKNAVRTAFRNRCKELKDVRDEIARINKDKEEIVKRHTRSTLITERVNPREMRVLPRGNWMDKSGDVVEPGVPHFLQQIEMAERATRLDLAQWMVSGENPLTARVFVNRLWKLYFGTGLSKILDDVGSQGELPSHPELLDTLAVEFVESGWDMKQMIKLIVMSSTYRQSSLMRDELTTTDPYNRLLARQSRYRLEAEIIRDNALAVSGLLVKKIGGRSVKPYQPAGLLRHLNFPKRSYQQDSGENQYRRGVYTHWQRQFLHPAMQIFDAPAREECTAERARSNTPLAALLLLNDPSYIEAARRFAENALKSTSENEDRIRWIVRNALSREPEEPEKVILLDLLEAEKTKFTASPEEAKMLIATGLSQANQELDPVELAAWTSLTRAILNLHETITRN